MKLQETKGGDRHGEGEEGVSPRGFMPARGLFFINATGKGFCSTYGDPPEGFYHNIESRDKTL